MTNEDYEKAKKLIADRDYYMKLAQDIAREQDIKERKDSTIVGWWQHLQYFGIRFWNMWHEDEQRRKATIGIIAHYEFAREIEINADKELIDLIRKWLVDKAHALDKEIEAI